MMMCGGEGGAVRVCGACVQRSGAHHVANKVSRPEHAGLAGLRQHLRAA